MHKKILLICLAFLLVGCTRVDDTDDYVSLVRQCLISHVSTNNVSVGYKYYIPKGVRKIHDYDYNQVFLIDDTYVYLYVDIVSYFYKKELVYDKSNQSVYYEKFVDGGKNGCIDVRLDDGLYYARLNYGYSKIEFYTNKDQLNKMITLSSIILNSIDYNDKVIEKVLEGKFGEFSEMSYEVDKPVDASNSFSQYLEDYAQKEKKEQKEDLPDK